MRPKEKASELVNKYFGITDVNFEIRQQKKCAIILVNQIISLMISFHGREIKDSINKIEYWQEVKEEIEKL